MADVEYDYLLKLTLIGDEIAKKGALSLRYVDDIWNDNIAPPNEGADFVNIIIIYIFKLFFIEN